MVIPTELKALAREFDLGAIILFARNVEEPAQVADVAREAAELADELPLWVSIDQEGGRVARLRQPFTKWPPMRALGRAKDEALAKRFATALATELKAVGITLDYTPVLDVLTNERNTVIGDRAFSDEAERVARLGQIIIRTLQAEGVAACGKHFPGHGDTSADSHTELPLVEHPPERLREVEWLPFKAAIEADVAFLMVGHLFVPALDETEPGSLSRPIVTGALREELGFAGPILTDDLDMRAVADTHTAGELVIKAITAGCDGLLICGGNIERQVEALEALVRAAERGDVPITRIEDALKRQRLVKERFLLARPPTLLDLGRRLRLIGCAEHQAIAEEMARFV